MTKVIEAKLKAKKTSETEAKASKASEDRRSYFDESSSDGDYYSDDDTRRHAPEKCSVAAVVNAAGAAPPIGSGRQQVPAVPTVSTAAETSVPTPAVAVSATTVNTAAEASVPTAATVNVAAEASVPTAAPVQVPAAASADPEKGLDPVWFIFWLSLIVPVGCLALKLVNGAAQTLSIVLSMVTAMVALFYSSFKSTRTHINKRNWRFKLFNNHYAQMLIVALLFYFVSGVKGVDADGPLQMMHGYELAGHGMHSRVGELCMMAGMNATKSWWSVDSACTSHLTN